MSCWETSSCSSAGTLGTLHCGVWWWVPGLFQASFSLRSVLLLNDGPVTVPGYGKELKQGGESRLSLPDIHIPYSCSCSQRRVLDAVVLQSCHRLCAWVLACRKGLMVCTHFGRVHDAKKHKGFILRLLPAFGVKINCSQLLPLASYWFSLRLSFLPCKMRQACETCSDLKSRPNNNKYVLSTYSEC